MEQTINTSTTTGATAAPAPQGAAAVTAAAPNGTAAPDAAAQFGTLLDALQMTAALAPVTESGDHSHAGTSAKDAKADDQKDGTTTDAAASAVAASLVPAAVLVPAATTLTPSLPIAGAPAGEPAGQPAAAPVTGVIAPQPAAGPALPVAGAADAAEAGTASPAATAATGPASSGPAPSGPATTGPAAVLPDGDVDPALVEAAVTAAAATVPARSVTAGRATARAATTAADAASDDAAGTATVATDAVTTTAAATTDTAPVTPADAPAGGGNDTATSSGNGQGGRLDLQVQPAPRLKEAAPAALTEATVAPIDRDRLERLADGLAVRLRVSHAAEGARIRMQLEPRELGEVVVRLEIHNGIAHAHLIAESADAGRALSSSLSDLRSALADRGLQLESVSVRVAGEGASNNGGGQAGQSQADRRGRGPLTFGRLDPVATTAATDTADRPHEGQAVWMLA